MSAIRSGRDHGRGLHAFPFADPERIADRALRNFTGYGPLEPLLADDDVWEIMVNGPPADSPSAALFPTGCHDEVTRYLARRLAFGAEQLRRRSELRMFHDPVVVAALGPGLRLSV